MKKSSISTLALFTLAVGLQAGEPRPNIILILSDDHAVQTIGAYGSKINQTPNIDRLAREGMLFENCFCMNSLCSPSRATILTGLTSNRNRVRSNYDHLSDRRYTTFPELLHQAGYQTAIVGKAMDWGISKPAGFDYCCIEAGGEYTNPHMNLNGKVQTIQGHAMDITTDRAMQWLNRRDSSKPFFLMFNPPLAHAPFIYQQRFAGLYTNGDIPEPSTLMDDYATRSAGAKDCGLRLVPTLDKAIQHWGHSVPGDLQGDALKKWTYQWLAKSYLRCVAGIDDGVGQLLAWLDKNKLAGNTIVIYSSDQGFFVGEHGWYDKRLMYEESLRMPLVVRGPGLIRPGSINTNMVSNLDFAQTLLDLAGVTAPAEMQGASLVPLLKGKTPADWRTAVYYHYYEYDPSFPWAHVRPHVGVRTRRYKLIHYYTLNAWELYDLKDDPHELNNLYGEPEIQGLTRRLKQELLSLQRQYGDSTPVTKQK